MENMLTMLMAIIFGGGACAVLLWIVVWLLFGGSGESQGMSQDEIREAMRK